MFRTILGVVFLVAVGPIVVAAIAQNREALERWAKTQGMKLRIVVGRAKKVKELRRARKVASEM